MRKFLLFSSLLFACLFVRSQQTYNLCGIWFAYGYKCSNIVGNQFVFYDVPVEILHIEQDGQNVKATKITGDPCVPAGNVTWYGTYDSSYFKINICVGSPKEPAKMFVGGEMTVVSSTYITGLGGGTYRLVKASCEQIDSLQKKRINTGMVDATCMDCPYISGPNVFSPNGDLTNDLFFVKTSAEELSAFELTIFDRWGKEVFKTKSLSQGWNGKHLDKPVPEGVYYWSCSFASPKYGDKPYKRGGFVTVLR